MRPNPKHRRSSHKVAESIAALLLMSMGALTIALSTEVYRGRPLAPLGVLAGTALIAAGIERDRCNRLNRSHYWQGLQDLGDSIDAGVQRIWRQSKPIMKQVICIENVPDRYRPLMNFVAERLLSEDWVSTFVKRSKLVVGVTRSGKTTWMLYEIAVFFREHPGGHLTICDLNFGKPDEDGNVNDWYGLPKSNFIRSEYDEIFEALRAEWEELQDRRLICMPDPPSSEAGRKHWKELASRRTQYTQKDGRIKLPRRKFMIDEAIAFINSAKNRDKLKPQGVMKDLPQVQLWISDLLYQGLGYQMEFTGGLQVLAVEESGLNLAMQEQVNILLLGASAINSRNVARLPGVEDADSLIDDLKRLRKYPGCEYAALAKIGAETPSIKIVPRLDISAIEIQLPTETLSTLDQWWKEVFSTEVREWMEQLAIDYSEKRIGSPLKSKICPKFGVETRSNCPRYQRVKQAWADAVSKAKGVSK